MKTILLIEDHQEFREFLSEILSAHDCDVISARCPDDAFRALRGDLVPDLIVSDLDMPFTLGKNFFEYKYSYEVGFRTIEELTWVYPGIPVIAMTAMPDHVVAEARERLPDVPILRKPFPHGDLLNLIQEFCPDEGEIPIGGMDRLIVQ